MLMMQIADRQNVSLANVMGNYTDKELQYWRVYLAREPSDGIRSQYLMTQLLNMFHHANSKNSKTKPSDFAYPDMWTSFIKQDVNTIRALLNGK